MQVYQTKLFSTNLPSLLDINPPSPCQAGRYPSLQVHPPLQAPTGALEIAWHLIRLPLLLVPRRHLRTHLHPPVPHRRAHSEAPDPIRNMLCFYQSQISPGKRDLSGILIVPRSRHTILRELDEILDKTLLASQLWQALNVLMLSMGGPFHVAPLMKCTAMSPTKIPLNLRKKR